MRNIITWIVTVALAVPFLKSASAKMASAPEMVNSFAHFGYPQWFMYVTGGLEIVGVVLIFIPRLAFAGAGLLSCIMVGALFSHLTHGEADKIGLPVILLVLALVLGTLRNWGRPAQAGGSKVGAGRVLSR